MSFAADKPAGELAEIALRRWCDCAGLSTEGAPGKFPAFDFFIRASVEVKRDGPAARIAFLIGVEKLRAVLHTLETRTGPDGKQGRLLPLAKLRSLPHRTVNLSEFLE